MPEGLEDEEELDEDDGEGDEAGEKDGMRRADVPCLGWELAGKGRGFGRVFPGAGADVAIPAAGVDEGKLDAEPEHDDADESAEWDGSR